MQAAYQRTAGNVTTVQFGQLRKERDLDKAVAEAKRPRRISEATKRAQRAHAVRLAAKLAL